jgi:signal transduction histidine kinase
MKTARILVIDDDRHVREALVDELSQMYRVETVSSGGEAFDALATRQYDVIISDLEMPDHDGIEVLEFARRHQRDAVRVLLTGDLDERTHRALMSPDAPYKVGKPWRDEIDIVIRRGLEQRDLARRLFASVDDALSLNTFDSELATTRTPLELGQLIVRRALTVDGVTACGTIVRVDGDEHTFTGGSVPKEGPGWFVDLPLDAGGELRMRARGLTDGSRHLVQYMAHRAQRACGILEARFSPLPELLGGGIRTNQLMRQATVGALTSALLHDLASTMQSLSGALSVVTEVAGTDAPELREALAEANSAGNEAIELFVQMRKFIRDGVVVRRPVTLKRLLDRVTRLAGGSVRATATLRISEIPEMAVDVSETLFVHVLVNVLRNAAHASPEGGVIDVKILTSETEIVFSITDDGPGVAPEIADTMFEPFASVTDESTGLGLAISAYVMQMCGGRISYRKDPERGACFSVTLPRAEA